MFVFTYQCDGCQFRGVAHGAQIGYYAFGDGHQMPAATSIAWCHKCNTFTSAEKLPTVDAIREEITRLRNKQTNELDVELARISDRSLSEFIASRLAGFIELYNRFRDRQSENRCIECGCTDFDYLLRECDAMPEQWPHPNCHGTLRLIETFHAIPATYFTLDDEGNRVPEWETPPRLHCSERPGCPSRFSCCQLRLKGHSLRRP